MYKIFRKPFMILFALFLSLTLFTFTAFADDAVAIRVGDRTYSVSEVQQYVDRAAVSLQNNLGMTLSAIYGGDEAQAFLQDAAGHFVTMGMIERKADELGLSRLTREEEDSLWDFAREYYEQLWQQMSEKISTAYPDLEDADLEEIITETLETSGYTLDEVYNDARLTLIEGRLIERFCGEIAVTDEDAAAYYQEVYVQPDRELYENDILTFEQNVLFGGLTSCYVPEGYFYIKYILLNPTETAKGSVTVAQDRLEACQLELENARTALGLAALEQEDPDALGKAGAAYQAAEQAAADAEAALEDAKSAAEAEYESFYDLIAAALESGTSFEELMTQYSVLSDMTSAGEPGYPFHPDSVIWDPRLAEAARGLKRYGDLTHPIYALDSIYLVCRMDDMVTGAYEPDAETMTQLKDNLLLEKQTGKLDELIEEWKSGVEIEMDISGLKMPAL